MLTCPRDGAELVTGRDGGIEAERCPTCNGSWLDHDELDQLEATVAPDEEQRRATIEYAKRPSELNCPVCGEPMRAFNYRAYNLELDACEHEHGFWLDAAEESRVRDIVQERVRGLGRATSAQEAWGRLIGRAGQRSVWDKIKGIFGGR